MELLVALVIGSLVITLAIRGLGLGLSVYERVGRFSAALDVRFRESAWWADSVAGLLACNEPAHCLRGTASYFEGYTLAGVLHPPGQRTPVRWELAGDGDRHRLQLAEGARAQDGAAVPMTLALPAGARFAYLHPDGRWLNEWSPATGNERLPEAIRIETAGKRPLALAVPVQRPYPRLDYRDIMGL